MYCKHSLVLNVNACRNIGVFILVNLSSHFPTCFLVFNYLFVHEGVVFPNLYYSTIILALL